MGKRTSAEMILAVASLAPLIFGCSHEEGSHFAVWALNSTRHYIHVKIAGQVVPYVAPGSYSDAVDVGGDGWHKCEAYYSPGQEVVAYRVDSVYVEAYWGEYGGFGPAGCASYQAEGGQAVWKVTEF